MVACASGPAATGFGFLSRLVRKHGTEAASSKELPLRIRSADVRVGSGLFFFNRINHSQDLFHRAIFPLAGKVFEVKVSELVSSQTAARHACTWKYKKKYG